MTHHLLPSFLALLLSTAPLLADPDLVRLGAQGRLHPEIRKDLSHLPRDASVQELRRMAQAALIEGHPTAFTDTIGALIDPDWRDLTEPQAISAILAWLPDTGSTLEARIHGLSRFERLQPLDRALSIQAWRDIRARVERTGDADLFLVYARDLAGIGHADLLSDSLHRFHPSPRTRIDTLGRLLLNSAEFNPAARQVLVSEMRSLLDRSDLVPETPLLVARALLAVGQGEMALKVMDRDPDPAARLEFHFDMLIDGR